MFETFSWQDLFPFLQFVLLVIGVVAFVAVVIVLKNLARLLESTTRTMDQAEKTVAELRDSVVPILASADTSMDTLNLQLQRLDNILSGFESTTQRVAHTAETASGIVQTPVEFVAGVTDKLVRGWRERRAHSQDML
ncbi:MAG: DUF948 domain-containing protein [Coriobacteriia bacterium]|nr:DUF948 domain-containing protein [Coriobacteriia bacterium]